MKTGNPRVSTKTSDPQRGDIWFVQLDNKPPAVGHEQAQPRPMLILSVNRFNKSPAQLVIALAITSHRKGVPWHVEIAPPEGGVDVASFIMCESIRTLSHERLLEFWGAVTPDTLSKVEKLVKVLLGV